MVLFTLVAIRCILFTRPVLPTRLVAPDVVTLVLKDDTLCLPLPSLVERVVVWDVNLRQPASPRPPVALVTSLPSPLTHPTIPPFAIVLTSWMFDVIDDLDITPNSFTDLAPPMRALL